MNRIFSNSTFHIFLTGFVHVTAVVIMFCACAFQAHAATLKVSPETGVYTVGNTFTVRVVVNTQGKNVNAADGQLSFNPRELSVVSASRTGSIFSLWTEEPSFSNSVGTVSFGGGSPAGYTGGAGSVISVTFKALGAGTPKITFKSGSILAADGMGTNILTAMTGGTYTVSAQTASPEPEQVEYIAPANTPKAPSVTSSTHPDQTLWYTEKIAKLSWPLPSGVTGIRTLLDSAQNTIPTIVYDDPFTSKEISDLEEGESYFHIQFKNADGWGKVTHYRLGVDSEAPKNFTISEATDVNSANPTKVLMFAYEDVSPVKNYTLRIDGGEQINFTDEKLEKSYTLPVLPPGHHTIVVEARDAAENVSVASYSFDITSFEKPVFTEYPERLSSGVIPALRGTTRPRAEVIITLTHAAGTIDTYSVSSDDAGVFTFIPNNALERGVYEITAIATDEYGAVSETSDTVRLIVEEPGYVRIGTFMVQVLSVIVPLIALVLLATFGVWFLWHKLRVWQKRVRTEAFEAEDKLKIELDEAVSNLNAKVGELRESRKGKLTKAELALIEQIEIELKDVREKVRKEIVDIEDIVS